MKLRNSTISLAASLLLAACAGPVVKEEPSTPVEVKESPSPITTPTLNPALESLRTLVQMQDRIERIAAPLLLKNANLCKSQARNLLGLTAKNRYSYSSEYTEAASQLFGLQEQLQVIGVLPGSGASSVGIRRGDILLRVEGRELPHGQNAERIAATILAPLVAGKANVKMSILRNGDTSNINVPLTRACGFRVELGNADNVASYGDGGRVMLTRGMLGFAKTDEEVAYVIAKEMAHNALSHQAKSRNSHSMSAMIDNLILVNPDLSLLITGGGIKAYSAETDGAADQLALYMLARAGYSIENVRSFWQRLANQYPATVLNGHTAMHPNILARMAVMDKTASDIRSKIAAKKNLTP